MKNRIKGKGWSVAKESLRDNQKSTDPTTIKQRETSHDEEEERDWSRPGSEQIDGQR